jgi:hypothetical protein
MDQGLTAIRLGLVPLQRLAKSNSAILGLFGSFDSDIWGIWALVISDLKYTRTNWLLSKYDIEAGND